MLETKSTKIEILVDKVKMVIKGKDMIVTTDKEVIVTIETKMALKKG